MKTFLLTAAILGLVASNLQAQPPPITPPTLEEALTLKGHKALVLQPLQIKTGQTLFVTYTGSTKVNVRPGTQQGAMLVIYSTDPADDGKVVFQDIHFFTAAGPGAGPHVKVFNGFTAAPPQGATRQGIIAILIGLLLPANSPDANVVPLPNGDAISAELHDPNTGIGMLLPAVQKVREAAAR